MAFLTPAGSSTSTTNGHSLPRVISCLPSITATTYIIVYVDDTFIFSNSQDNIDNVIKKVVKHYELTLNREVISFLGLNLAHNEDGTVTITQPKLLAKLFALYPPRKDSAH